MTVIPLVCGARTRSGEPCKVAPVPGSKRCRRHGGLSTGPKSAAGRERIAEAQRQRWAQQRDEAAEALARLHAQDAREETP